MDLNIYRGDSYERLDKPSPEDRRDRCKRPAAPALVVDDGQVQRLWIVGLDDSQTEIEIASHDKVWHLSWSPN